MTSQHVSDGDEGKKRDPDLIFAETAMKRAARKARERARQVGAGVVILRNGQIVQERLETPPQTDS